MAEVDQSGPDVGPSASGTRPGMWWVRPAFGAVAAGMGAPLARVIDWVTHESQAPTAGGLAGRVVAGVALGLLWGFGGNWVASWGQARR